MKKRGLFGNFIEGLLVALIGTFLILFLLLVFLA